MTTSRLSIDWEQESALTVAPQLLGWELVGRGASGRIVEVEAYEPDDPASHSFGGETKRNAAMFGPPGHLYAYLIYGMHICANVVVGPTGHGAAVLIRAIEPMNGVDVMCARRKTARERSLGSGPGKLCQALGVSLEDDGTDLWSSESDVRLRPPDAPDGRRVLTGPRIGISKAVDRPWRFGLAGSVHLSRPFPHT